LDFDYVEFSRRMTVRAILAAAASLEESDGNSPPPLFTLRRNGRSYDGVLVLARASALLGSPNLLESMDPAHDLSAIRALVQHEFSVKISSRSPTWSRDELILALDLYFELGGTTGLSASHPAVEELSRELRTLPVFDPIVRGNPSFRTPSSVALKLHNLALIDPSHAGAAMSHGGRGDSWVWQAWAQDRDLLRLTAEAIRKVAADESAPVDLARETAYRGGQLLYRHLVALERRSTEQPPTDNNAACPVCGEDFADRSIEPLFVGEPHVLGDWDEAQRWIIWVCGACHQRAHADGVEMDGDLMNRPRGDSPESPPTSAEKTTRAVVGRSELEAWLVERALAHGGVFSFDDVRNWIHAHGVSEMPEKVRQVLIGLANRTSSQVVRHRHGRYTHVANHPQQDSPRAQASGIDVAQHQLDSHEVRCLLETYAANTQGPFAWPTLRDWLEVRAPRNSMGDLKATFDRSVGDPRKLHDTFPIFKVVTGRGQYAPIEAGELRGRDWEPWTVEHAVMRHMRHDGHTLQEIADVAGVTRERVRQILSKYGITNAAAVDGRARESAARHRSMSRRAIRDLREHPGTTIDEAAERMRVSAEDLRGLDQTVTRLYIQEARSAVVSRSDMEILESVRDAATYEYPLTSAAYADLVRRGVVNGPSLPGVTLRFGSWSAACERAGVEHGQAVRTYDSAWTDHDLVTCLAEFLATSSMTSIQAFETWVRPRDTYPSGVTIRNRFGSWSAAKSAGLGELARRADFWVALENEYAEPDPEKPSQDVMQEELSDDATSIISVDVITEGETG
jgi:5-methylcytosine-specific restriction protein A